jgi:hypothetical protein
LHVGLAGDQPRQEIVVKGKIGGRNDRPRRHDDQSTNAGPERDGTDAKLPPAMPEREVGQRRAAALAQMNVVAEMDSNGVGNVMDAVAMNFGPVGHGRSCAVPAGRPTLRRANLSWDG